MFQIPLINSVRLLEKRIEVGEQHYDFTRERVDRTNHKKFSTGMKPVAESESIMFHTSLINTVQNWERRWQVEEEQRLQRTRVAEASHEIFLRRLPRLKLAQVKESDETAQFHSCCQAASDYHNALHS